MRVLIVDDEALARQRLKTLIADCEDPKAEVAAEARDASEALAWLERNPVDVALLDIHMPGLDGIGLAQAIGALARPPAVVFVTADPRQALKAFEIEAIDYLTKPVRLERLVQALRKAQRLIAQPLSGNVGPEPPTLLIRERDRVERLPISQVLYVRSELKYVTVRTASRSYLLEGSLSDIEEKYGVFLLRVHRGALVARRSVRSLERRWDANGLEGWAVHLSGIEEPVPVSRRQLAAVREAIESASHPSQGFGKSPND